MKEKRITILSVAIDNFSKKQVLFQVKRFLKERRRSQIVTVNPEFIIEAQSNKNFREVLNRADLSICDGIGVKAAAKYLDLPKSKKMIVRFFQTIFQGFCLIGPSVIFNRKYLNTIKELIPGSDISIDLARLAADSGYRIFLLGAQPGIAEKAAHILKKDSQTESRWLLCRFSGKEEGKKLVSLINSRSTDILLVAYGSPQQELWIDRNLKKIDRPIVAVGVGGTFDFIAGRIRRAPGIIRRLGLEWLFRLVQEPSRRIGRICRAVIIFPFLVWIDTLKSSQKKNLTN